LNQIICYEGVENGRGDRVTMGRGVKLGAGRRSLCQRAIFGQQMRIGIALLLVFGAGAIAANAQTTTTSSPPTGTVNRAAPPMPVETCFAEPAQRLIGRVASPRAVGQAKRLAKATIVRTLRSNGVATREYGYGRLNVIINDRNIIVAIHCG
jgi:Peptidase inhibitor I78 family